MPFVPPVSIIVHSSPSRPVSGGLTGNATRAMNRNDTSATAVPSARTKKAPVEDGKGGSMTERLASNLRHLGGKKSQPRSRLPAGKATPGSGLNAKCKGQWLSSPSPLAKRLSGTVPHDASRSASKTAQCGRGGPDSALAKGRPHEAKVTAGYGEEEAPGARFTLTLTPEAVLLLQRQSHERQRRLADWKATAGYVPGYVPATDAWCRRHGQPMGASGGTLSSRAAVRDVAPGDVGSLLKISLLNEWHKYDDVEYEEEEEEDCAVDERLVMKCTEWLRGLESAPVSPVRAAGGVHTAGTSLKSF